MRAISGSSEIEVASSVLLSLATRRTAEARGGPFLRFNDWSIAKVAQVFSPLVFSDVNCEMAANGYLS